MEKNHNFRMKEIRILNDIFLNNNSNNFINLEEIKTEWYKRKFPINLLDDLISLGKMKERVNWIKFLSLAISFLHNVC